METTQRNSSDILRDRATMGDMAADTGALTDPVTPAIQPGMESTDIKERAKQVAQDAMDMGTKAVHAVSDKIHQYPDMAETSRGKGRMIAIGSMTAAGIGMMVKRRQHNKTKPQNIAGRAKDLISSR